MDKENEDPNRILDKLESLQLEFEKVKKEKEEESHKLDLLENALQKANDKNKELQASYDEVCGKVRIGSVSRLRVINTDASACGGERKH